MDGVVVPELGVAARDVLQQNGYALEWHDYPMTHSVCIEAVSYTHLDVYKRQVVHELAHLKEREHNKAFYQLCQHMEPAYHSLEFDLRTYLHFMDTTGVVLWKVHE